MSRLYVSITRPASRQEEESECGIETCVKSEEEHVQLEEGNVSKYASLDDTHPLSFL